MSEQLTTLVTFSQGYLSVLLQINILLITGHILLMWFRPPRCLCLSLLWGISLAGIVFGIIIILIAYKDCLNLIFFYQDKTISQMEPFSHLNALFLLDLPALAIDTIIILRRKK